MAVAYERIADELRTAIRAGRLGPGERLPAETKLAERFGRSVPTVREALRALQDEGLLEKRHGVGNFVRCRRTLARRTNLRHQWEKDRARAPLERRAQTGATEHDTGLHVEDLVFRARYREVAAPAGVAEVLGVPEGTALLERRYRTRCAVEHAPFSLVTSYLVHDMIAGNPALLDEREEPWPGGSQSQLFSVGIEVDRVEEHVTARPPTPEEADELELPPGTSVLVLRKVSYATDQRVVDVSDVILPGDRTELVFTTPLERW
ncbi:GntR family transcriptional regulator [Streptomyces sp. x-19]|uniref:GntR family transcriptional regulator n=1 Tax=Streptomyces sp. x-19 TaxID=2789280 RepID=UPI00397F02E4